MAYRLRKIRYEDSDYHILLQNENGPCPLLAAANCLILKGSITLPSNCVGAGMVTIDQLVNVLAEKILSNHESGQADHHVQEVLTIFPSLQFGMDVNPKFTAGPTGVEYTMHLNAFDLLNLELVHGWLLDPEAEEFDLIGSKTYNQLVNMVIEGNDAAATLQNVVPQSGPISGTHDDLSTKATQGSIVKHFLDTSGHQLTHYGLTVLHEYLREGQMVVFFRNNHFNTMTKHDGLLYLLVTDFGYANVSTVVWENLNTVDGDTEYVTDAFVPPPSLPAQINTTAASPEQMMANNMQSQADYQLALQLSQENASTRTGAPRPGTAMPSSFNDEMEAARQASLQEYNRTNPHAALPNTRTGNSYLSSFEHGMNPLSTSVRQAGTSIQEAASSMFPPSASTSTPTRTTAGSANPNSSNDQSSTSLAHQQASAPRARSPRRETVATGVPAEAPSQEQQDLMFAMQLQRQEENDRARQNTNYSSEQQQSRKLAMTMARKGRSRENKHAAKPAPPPERLSTAPPSRRGKDENCVIS